MVETSQLTKEEAKRLIYKEGKPITEEIAKVLGVHRDYVGCTVKEVNEWLGLEEEEE